MNSVFEPIKARYFARMMRPENDGGCSKSSSSILRFSQAEG
jgi:hypothetical protein